MSDQSDLIICEYCDSVYRRPTLTRFQKAHCQRCGALIHRYRMLSLDQWLALTVTAAILLVFVLWYPILDIHLQGQVRSATLFESALALARGPISVMAVTVACAVLLVPALQICLLLWVLLFARRSRRAPGFVWSLRLLEILRHWSMLEVFLLGALVGVVKLTGRLEVVPATGLFALALLSILIIGLAGRGLHRLWEDTE